MYQFAQTNTQNTNSLSLVTKNKAKANLGFQNLQATLLFLLLLGIFLGSRVMSCIFGLVFCLIQNWKAFKKLLFSWSWHLLPPCDVYWLETESYARNFGQTLKKVVKYRKNCPFYFDIIFKGPGKTITPSKNVEMSLNILGQHSIEYHPRTTSLQVTLFFLLLTSRPARG